MVAHDPKTGKSNKPTTIEVSRDKDGKREVRFPNDPQINAPDRDVVAKPQATLTGYVRGGTSNPSEGLSGEPAYFLPDGTESDAQTVLGSGPNATATERQAQADRQKANKADTVYPDAVEQPVDDPAESTSGKPLTKRAKAN